MNLPNFDNLAKRFDYFASMPPPTNHSVELLKHGAAAEYVVIHRIYHALDNSEQCFVEKKFTTNNSLREIEFYSSIRIFKYNQFSIPNYVVADRKERTLITKYVGNKKLDISSCAIAGSLGRALGSMTGIMSDVLSANKALSTNIALRNIKLIKSNSNNYDIEKVLKSPVLRPYNLKSLEVILSSNNEIYKSIERLSTVFCHNDIKQDNILIDRDRPAFIDWADSSLGPLGADLGGGIIHEIAAKFSIDERNKIEAALVDGYINGLGRSNVHVDEVNLACAASYVSRFLPRILSGRSSKHLIESFMKKADFLVDQVFK
ncbi:MAG: phosphotransferase [Oceanicaulis sp.]|nr:phosphotransferase [Oceanicaulis sp.]